MRCAACRSTAVRHRSERTAQGYRRFRCRNCGKQFNERSAGLLNRAQYPSDVIALVVLWRLRYKLSLRDLDEMFLIRWYRDIGGGMGQALNAASAMPAYTLSDRGTWLSFANKGSLLIAVEGDPRLINRYNVIEL